MADEEQTEVAEKSSGKGLIIVLMVIMILLIVGIGVMAFLLLSGDKDGDKDSKSAEEQHGSASHGDKVAEDVPKQFKNYNPPEPGSAPQYFAMEPFVVNFKGEGQAKFLAVTLKFMTHYPELVVDMENYKPILRHDVASILRVQSYTVMNQDDGADILRAKILEKARSVLEKNGIFPDLLEDVYFERFVMQ